MAVSDGLAAETPTLVDIVRRPLQMMVAVLNDEACRMALDALSQIEQSLTGEPPEPAQLHHRLPREGILTVYDHHGRYVGCVGEETFRMMIGDCGEAA